MPPHIYRIFRILPRPVVVALSLSCVVASARGDNLQDPTNGDMVLFPGPLLEQTLPSKEGFGDAAMSRPVVLGWNVPGKSFRAGGGWWGLICDTTCRLSQMRMEVMPATHPVYDSDPTPSQILSWSPLPRSLVQASRSGWDQPKLLAMFKPVRSLQGLALTEGPVKTWLHQAMAHYPAGGRLGTMEVAIPMAPNSSALLVPRLRRAQTDPAPDAEASAQVDTLALELRINGRRQLLGHFDTSGIEGLGPVTSTSYLMWAGDLDGDGKLDLLIDFLASNGRQVELFLSTLAKGEDFVGSAGSFNFYDPSSAGC